MTSDTRAGGVTQERGNGARPANRLLALLRRGWHRLDRALPALAGAVGGPALRGWAARPAVRLALVAFLALVPFSLTACTLLAVGRAAALRLPALLAGPSPVPYDSTPLAAILPPLTALPVAPLRHGGPALRPRFA